MATELNRAEIERVVRAVLEKQLGISAVSKRLGLLHAPRAIL